MNYDNLYIILVEPQGPLNVGSICRSMMNFGFTKLRLVSPCKDYMDLQAKKMALSAFKVLENAEIFDTLNDALADIHAAFGTTRRFGKYRKNFLTPATAGEKINALTSPAHGDQPGHKCALVMGREDTGLETHHLDLCQHFITIPTHDGYPSMNLSHATSVLLYEVAIKSDAGQKFHDPAPKKLASGDEVEHLFQHMRKTLRDIEYLDPQNPDHLLRT
ncbi:MAG: RNA methyltransferase, partial [Desulfobacterales bacterium]|nr:RNA methyltransferase [Desulfobacterales bacterium]